MSKRLPLKKRTVHQGDQGVSSPSDSPGSSHSPAEAKFSSHHLDPFPSHGASSSTAEDPSFDQGSYPMAMSPGPSTSSFGGPSTSEPHIPHQLANYVPENIFPPADDAATASQAVAASDQTEPKKKKKKKQSFSYFIAGKPIDPYRRSRHKSGSDTRQGGSGGPLGGLMQESLDSGQYSSQASNPLPGPSDPYPPQPSYDHYDPKVLRGGIIQPTPVLATAGSSPFGTGTIASGFAAMSFSTYGHGQPQAPPPHGHHHLAPVKKKNPQRCRLCANHGHYVLVRGHKFECNYRDCPCPDCKDTRLKQEIMRKSAKQTRLQDAELRQQQYGSDAYPSTSRETPPSSPSYNPQYDSE